MSKPKSIAAFFEQLKQSILESKVVTGTLNYSKKNSFVGFEGVPIYDVVLFFIKEIQKDNINTRANSIAFSFFISLFPSLIVLFTLIPIFFPLLENWLLSLLPNSSGLNFEQALLMQLNEILPNKMAHQINTFIQGVVSNPQFGTLSIGFLMAIYFASNGMLNLMAGFEKSYAGAYHSRNGFQKRLISIQLTAMVGILLVFSVVLIILGESLIPWLLERLKVNTFQTVIFNLIRWLIIVALYYFAIGIIYRYAPALTKRLGLVNTGTTVATLLSIIASIGFSYYVDNFGTYNKLYGFIGTIIALMIWMQINSTVILIGYEINAAIAVNKSLLLSKEEKQGEEKVDS